MHFEVQEKPETCSTKKSLLPVISSINDFTHFSTICQSQSGKAKNIGQNKLVRSRKYEIMIRPQIFPASFLTWERVITTQLQSMRQVLRFSPWKKYNLAKMHWPFPKAKAIFLWKILGPPKHVWHLVCSPMPEGPKSQSYYKGNLFGLKMGLSSTSKMSSMNRMSSMSRFYKFYK